MDHFLIMIIPDQTTFLYDFFVGLSSGLVISIIAIIAGTFIYPWWAHFTYRPKLKFVDPRTGSPTISSIKNHVGAYEILFGIKNESYLPIKNLSWHIIFFLSYPLGNIQSEPNSPTVAQILLEDGRYLIKVDSNKNCEVDIRAKATLSNLWPLTVSLSNPNNLPNEVYYYFSTDYGYIPRSIYKYENEFTLNQGQHPNLEHWGKAEIKVK